MKRRKVTALVLAASMIVSGLGQTSAVFGSEFTAEALYEEPPGIMGGDSAVEITDTFAAEETGAAGAFGGEEVWISDGEEQPEEFVSDEAEAASAFTDGGEENSDEGTQNGEEGNPYSSVIIQGELRDSENGTTIFTNEALNYTVDTTALEGLEYEINWQAGVYEFNGVDYDFVEDPDIPFEVSGGGQEAILDGTKLRAGNDFNLRAGIIVDGEEVHAADIMVCVREPEYHYDELPFFYERSTNQLPRWWTGIYKQFICRVKDGEHYCNGWGEDILLEVLSVTAENAADDEGEGDAVSVNPFEDGDGWSIDMNRMGHGIVTVTYQTYDGGEDSYTIDFYIGDGVYSVDMESDTGTDTILPGKSLTLNAWTRLECYDPESDTHGDGDASNAQIRWEYDENLGNFIFTENEDGTLTVGATEAVEEEAETETVVTAAAYIPGEEGEEDIRVAECGMWIYIRNGYHTLTVDWPDTTWKYGETRTLTPELRWFSEENDAGAVIANENVRYRVEGDWNWLTVTDAAGKELSQEDDWGTAPFTVTRRGDWGTDIGVVAYLYDEESDAENEEDRYYEAARNQVWIDGFDCNIWFDGDGMREDGYTWVYSDEDLFISLNTDNLQNYDSELVKVEWSVGTWNDETESIDETLPEEAYTADAAGIILHGAALDKIREQLRDGCGFDVQARVMVNGEERNCVGFGADVREPYEEMDDWDEDLLPGWYLQYDNGNQIRYRVENQKYPYGAEEMLTITNIEVEDLRETPDQDNPVLVVEHEEDEWKVLPKNYGEARLTYTAEGKEFGVVTYSVIKNVVGSTYRVGVTADPYEVMLPGTEITLEPHVWHYMEGQDAVKLDESEYSIRYSYNEDAFAFTADGAKGKLKALAEDPISGYVEVEVTIEQADGEEPVVVNGGIEIYVETGYERLTYDLPVLTEPGATVSIADFNGALKHFDMEKPNGVVIEEAKLSLGQYAGADNNAFIKVSEDGQSFTVTEVPELGTEDGPLTAWLRMTATVDGQEGEEPPMWEKEVQISICNHKTVTAEEPPTCTEEGTKVVTCEKCGKVVENVVYPATGHNYEPSVTKAATCTAEGVKTYTCKNNCGHSYTEAIPKLAHKIVTVTDSQPTCGTPGKQHRECSLCHGVRTELPGIPATGNHTFGTYTVTKAATALAEGTETHTCSVCGAAESRAIAKLKAAIKLPSTSIPLKLKQTISFKAVLTTGDYLKSVKSSKTSVVKVKYDKNGTIKLTAQKKTGSAKVTVTTAAGIRKVITVKAQKAEVATTKITGVPKKLTLKRGKTSTLKPVLSPISSRQKITYTSSNKKVATVTSKGKIKAVKKGKAVITVKAGKKSYKCTVTVK